MKGLNKVLLMGRLGADPELRMSAAGMPIVKLSIATNHVTGKDQDKEERTEWHRVVLFHRKAEVAAQYLHKGDVVFIDGELRTNKWTDKDGKPRYSTEIIANRLDFGSNVGQSLAMSNGQGHQAQLVAMA